MEADAWIMARHQALEGLLDERQRRLHAVAEATALGYGGVKRVSQATGVARGSSLTGIMELELPQRALPDEPRRVRRAGAGRKKLVDRDLGNRKTLEGASHPVRNARFAYSNEKTEAALRARQPVISVDTKKELAGRYKNGGKKRMPRGEPE